TGLATLVGEELDVNPLDMDVRLAGAHEDYVNPLFGMQGTGGSTSIRAHYTQLRQVGANTRALILEAAAKDLGVAASSLTTDNGYVVAGETRHPYADFINTAQALTIDADAPLKPTSQFQYIGQETRRVDAIAKATGTAQFGIDVDVPGMHYAVVVRPPVARAKALSVNAASAKDMPGVVDVLEVHTGVAVVAETFWQAKQAAAKVEVQWESMPLEAVDTDTLRRDYAAALDGGDGVEGPNEGDIEAAMDAADVTHEAEYWAPLLSHSPMEPMNAVVRIEGDEADVWTGIQFPSAVPGLVSRVADIPAENVRFHQTYLGGGFGRRGSPSYVVEATEIAKATGKPIQLVWTREDDIQQGPFRPASLMRIKAGVDNDGNLIAWDAARAGADISPDTFRSLLPALYSWMGDGMIEGVANLSEWYFEKFATDESSTEGLFEDYDHPNTRVNHMTVDHELPMTFWRSVGHSYTAFAKESMIDELAEAAGLDEVAFRVQNTQNAPRLNNVIRVAGEHMAKMNPPAGHHLGFAAHHSFHTDVAEIAEVSVENGKIRVHKVTCVLDCGQAVNPDIVRSQIEGGVIYGLTAALYGGLNLERGAIKESNFHDYPMLRMSESPEIEVVIIDSGTKPTGVGEPGLPPIAPAVANAVYKATGQRLRSLPLQLA
ncbi:MAG: xanthine dehydrogenase family protein molybdopterin-binding subunit, partial [Congregibacter sp.]|nr:xanthine dehydrogenase family protein molybdopterin-binding subunit [Congregibacter sp.]